MTTDKRQRPCLFCWRRPMPIFCFQRWSPLRQGHSDSIYLRLSIKGNSSNLLCVSYWLKDHHIFGMVWSFECQNSSFIHTLNDPNSHLCLYVICTTEAELWILSWLKLLGWNLDSQELGRQCVEVLMEALCVYSGTGRNFFFGWMVYIPILTVFPPG